VVIGDVVDEEGNSDIDSRTGSYFVPFGYPVLMARKDNAGKTTLLYRLKARTLILLTNSGLLTACRSEKS
jgi:hypothetical protein